jgi:AraC family transcriptional regulator
MPALPERITMHAACGGVPCVAGHGTVLDELRVDGIRMVSVAHAPGLTIARHAHDLAKLAILVTGGATERIGHDLVEHRLLAVVARENFRAHENQYHARGARSLVVELEDLQLAGQLPPATARLHGRRLVAAFHAPRSGRARLVRAAVGDVVAALRDAPPRRAPAWLCRARELLFAQIVRPPRLAELAGRVGVHPVHLSQTFRRHWNTTPLGYVRAHRVFRAVELIAAGGALAEVAAAVGFADQSHMTRAIRRARAASPGALRQTMRDAAP